MPKCYLKGPHVPSSKAVTMVTIHGQPPGTCHTDLGVSGDIYLPKTTWGGMEGGIWQHLARSQLRNSRSVVMDSHVSPAYMGCPIFTCHTADRKDQTHQKAQGSPPKPQAKTKHNGWSFEATCGPCTNGPPHIIKVYR